MEVLTELDAFYQICFFVLPNKTMNEQIPKNIQTFL